MTNPNKLVAILPGPVRSVEELGKYRMLSDRFSGVILSSSNKDELFAEGHVGNFELRLVRFSYGHPVRYNAMFLLNCLLFVLNTWRNGQRYDLVVTYDPLKTGMMGAMVARCIGARFAPEVNGVYDSPAEYLDYDDWRVAKLKRMLYPFIEKKVLKQADGIKLLFPSQLQGFDCNLEDKIVHSFANYVPIERFSELEASEEKEVLFVGFPFKRKGVDILIEAFKSVAPDFPEWRLKILGWYPRPDELLRHIDGHQRITHHPPVPTMEMPQHIARCAILVLPSRSEAMGRILLEAMAAGKPRIGAAVDGIPTVIDSGVDGFLFEPGNIRDMADKLRLLMGDAGLRAGLGAAGRRRAINDFSGERYYERLNDFYAEILAC